MVSLTSLQLGGANWNDASTSTFSFIILCWSCHVPSSVFYHEVCELLVAVLGLDPFPLLPCEYLILFLCHSSSHTIEASNSEMLAIINKPLWASFSLRIRTFSWSTHAQVLRSLVFGSVTKKGRKRKNCLYDIVCSFFVSLLYCTCCSVSVFWRTRLCTLSLFLVTVSFFPGSSLLFSSLHRKRVTCALFCAASFLAPRGLLVLTNNFGLQVAEHGPVDHLAPWVWIGEDEADVHLAPCVGVQVGHKI